MQRRTSSRSAGAGRSPCCARSEAPLSRSLNRGRAVGGGLSARGRTEQRLELAPQHLVDFGHGHCAAEIGEAGDAVALIAHAAGHDTAEVCEIAVDVERDAVQRDPPFDADADRGDLVLAAGAFVRAAHPYPDAILAAFPGDVEGREG